MSLVLKNIFRKVPEPAQLETQRLRLVLAEPAQAALWAGFQQKNRSHLAPWDPQRDEDFFTPFAWQLRLENARLQYQQGSAIHWVLLDKQQDEMLGQCSFSNIVRGSFMACHLGYSLAASAEGKGLMKEALDAAIGHLFSTQDLHRIMANHLPHNLRSAKLLQRLGFEKEGYARSYLKIAGIWQDHILNSLLNPAHLQASE
ncbi:ribosomal protein S5-alanine N-acetyltransferase [Iodobacter ciconiae]|uniref:[Ribosomal protein uS5]-alanine N-acetyltransferase n=1 Tax=Iodobacter ciconiae TaxID=2496266 RepID=A0A3S8ZUC3_9NEIS|nr:ribosomal protein S5-alanine N-acetyltransferase [Iodobacter ciconiae]AZN37103.1 30S ribosomal protein S5 alanine N-acetyltransferase [Iodobacter ciconiae]